ncbi:hypothetical protein CXF85_02250 [Colwellia sp. 75C3]|uniref:DUF4386 family protein n=1 Tax=Colwellia sp. 75C3 TaxID=888425 RepID=UPI000C32145F|nr:DUF4386 family protein [Colwellia sp. 75C3]PKG85636.1 hypothetical protein CXF85_02250 [Colwellia sp. 75C3]
MNNLQKIGGFAALAQAVIYVLAFVYFGGFFDFPRGGDTAQKLSFLVDNQLILSVVNLIMYVVFGVFLAVLVLALYHRFKNSALVLSQLAAVFGVIWIGLVIASGMIANIGLATVIKLSVNEPEQAMTLWLTVNIIVEGLGGGNEVVGGLWLLLLSCAALKSQQFSKMLSYFGLFIGLAGIMTIYPAEVLTEIFGLGQIVWFVWLGASMLVKAEHR